MVLDLQDMLYPRLEAQQESKLFANASQASLLSYRWYFACQHNTEGVHTNCAASNPDDDCTHSARVGGVVAMDFARGPKHLDLVPTPDSSRTDSNQEGVVAGKDKDLPPDPTCATGVQNTGDHACCPKACGTCGGPSCAQEPGGYKQCCSGTVIGEH
jgi:hypothetical protein